jgi:hypothetical protein
MKSGARYILHCEATTYFRGPISIQHPKFQLDEIEGGAGRFVLTEEKTDSKYEFGLIALDKLEDEWA